MLSINPLYGLRKMLTLFGFIFGVDLSNWNGTLSPEFVQCLVANGVRHAVVRLSLETPAKIVIARQQIAALIAGGISVSGYVWCYADWFPRWTAQRTVAVYGDLALLNIWADAEDVDSFSAYFAGNTTGAVEWLWELLDEFQKWGYPGVGIYTARWCFLPMFGLTTAFKSYPLWVAEYDGNSDLTVWLRFGGWTDAVGKQWRGSGEGIDLCGIAVDLDTFLSSVLGDDEMTPEQVAAAIEAAVTPLREQIAALNSALVDRRFPAIRAGIEEMMVGLEDVRKGFDPNPPGG